MSILWEIVQRTSGKGDRLMKGFLVTLPVLDSLCVVLFPCLAFSCMIFVIIVLKSTSILRLMSPLFGGLSVRWSKLCNNRSINRELFCVTIDQSIDQSVHESTQWMLMALKQLLRRRSGGEGTMYER